MITYDLGNFLWYLKTWDSTGINIFSSEIILYHFKPKGKTCKGVFCLKFLSYNLSFLSFCFDIISVLLKCKKKVTYKNHLALH